MSCWVVRSFVVLLLLFCCYRCSLSWWWCCSVLPSSGAFIIVVRSLFVAIRPVMLMVIVDGDGDRWSLRCSFVVDELMVVIWCYELPRWDCNVICYLMLLFCWSFGRSDSRRRAAWVPVDWTFAHAACSCRRASSCLWSCRLPPVPGRSFHGSGSPAVMPWCSFITCRLPLMVYEQCVLWMCECIV